MISNNVKKRMRSYANIAKALKGNSQTGQSFHVCFAVWKRKVLAIGINNYKRSIQYTKYGPYKVFGSQAYRPCLHAEVSALLKLGLEDCSHLDFYNIRIDNNGQVAASAPCINCMNMLNTVGFKHIYFVNKSGKLDIITGLVNINTNSDYEENVDYHSAKYGIFDNKR